MGGLFSCIKGCGRCTEPTETEQAVDTQLSLQVGTDLIALSTTMPTTDSQPSRKDGQGVAKSSETKPAADKKPQGKDGSNTAESSTAKSAMAPTQTAAAAVFRTAELLEDILSRVDVRTLLLSQRVSRTWNEIITSSPPLQRQLFFLAEHAESIEHMTTGRRRNPLLEQVFAPWFVDKGHHRADDCPNPFEALFPRAGGQAAEAKRLAFTRREASWRRMLVQQPACERLGFIRESGKPETEYSGAVLRFPLPGSRWVGRRRRWGDKNRWPREDDDGEEDDTVCPWATEPEDAAAAAAGPSVGGGSHDSGGVRMGAMYDLLLRFLGHQHSPRIGYQVVWREPAAEQPAYGIGWRTFSDHTILYQKYFGPEVAIVVFQEGARRLASDMADPRLRREWVCEGAQDEEKFLDLTYHYAQDWFG